MATQENNQPAVLAAIDNLEKALDAFRLKASADFFAGLVAAFAKKTKQD
jgi:hypothetical protein